MRTPFTRARAAKLAFLSACIAPLALYANAAELQVVATMASNGLEGLDIAQDGSLYITDAIAHVIHKVDAAGAVSEFSNVGAAVQVILLTPFGAIVTGQERDPDFSALTRASPPAAAAPAAGAPAAPPAPRVGFNADAMGKLGPELIFVDKGGKVVRTIQGPDGAFLNGIARFGKAFLVADSASGTLWLYERDADQLIPWFRSDALRGPDSRFPGANGLKVLKDTVYVSNTAAGTIFTLRTSHGKPAGELVEFAHVASPDDFAVSHNGTVYLPSEGHVVRITRAGEQTVIADNCKGCDAAVLTDHERSLLLITHGFGANPGPGVVYRLSLSSR